MNQPSTDVRDSKRPSREQPARVARNQPILYSNDLLGLLHEMVSSSDPSSRLEVCRVSSKIFFAVNYLDLVLCIIETPNGPVMYTPSSPKKC